MEKPHFTSEQPAEAPEELVDIDEQPELEDSAEATHHRYGEAVMKTLAPTPEDTSGKKPEAAKGDNELTPEQTQDYQRAESFIKRYGMSMSVFSRDSSLKFKIEPGAETFAFDASDFSVIVPSRWFGAEKYSEDEILFANLHERGHFIDMMSDPEAYLGCFDRMTQMAEQEADRYIQSHPEAKDKRNALVGYIRRELHTLYNCLDDIYVNDLVVGRYKGFSARQAPLASVYKKLNFGDADLTQAPAHRQLAYALLRDAMIAGKTDPETGETIEPSIVAPEVQAKLDERHGTLPKFSEIIERYMRPAKNGRMVARFSPNKKKPIPNGPKYRHDIVIKYIEPAFFELLQPSLDKIAQQPDQEPDKNSSGDGKGTGAGEGTPNPGGERGNSSEESDNQSETSGDSGSGGEGSGNGQGEISPFGGDIDEETLRKILEAMKDAKKRGKDKVMADAKKEKWDQEHSITPIQRERYDRALNDMREARDQMRDLWGSFIGTSIEYRRVMREGQTSGKIDIRSIKRHYPAFMRAVQSDNFDNLAIYRRRILEKEVSPQAERIEVSLVVDCSGSMGGGDGPKESNGTRTGYGEEAAREAAALLLTSLDDFNNSLAFADSDLRADSEVLLFGSDFDYNNPEDVPKPFAEGRPSSDTQGDIVRCIGSINAEHGGTNDTLPIDSIRERLTDEQREAIKSGRLRKIVFEITDGATDRPDATKALVKQLANDGVIMICIHISDSGSEDTAISQNWQADPGNTDQIIRYISGKTSELPGILMRELYDILNQTVVI